METREAREGREGGENLGDIELTGVPRITHLPGRDSGIPRHSNEIELFSWAVIERCNLAETHFPASISYEMTQERGALNLMTCPHRHAEFHMIVNAWGPFSESFT